MKQAVALSALTAELAEARRERAALAADSARLNGQVQRLGVSHRSLESATAQLQLLRDQLDQLMAHAAGIAQANDALVAADAARATELVAVREARERDVAALKARAHGLEEAYLRAVARPGGDPAGTLAAIDGAPPAAARRQPGPAAPVPATGRSLSDLNRQLAGALRERDTMGEALKGVTSQLAELRGEHLVLKADTTRRLAAADAAAGEARARAAEAAARQAALLERLREAEATASKQQKFIARLQGRLLEPDRSAAALRSITPSRGRAAAAPPPARPVVEVPPTRPREPPSEEEESRGWDTTNPRSPPRGRPALGPTPLPATLPLLSLPARPRGAAVSAVANTYASAAPPRAAPAAAATPEVRPARLTWSEDAVPPAAAARPAPVARPASARQASDARPAAARPAPTVRPAPAARPAGFTAANIAATLGAAAAAIAAVMSPLSEPRQGGYGGGRGGGAQQAPPAALATLDGTALSRPRPAGVPRSALVTSTGVDDILLRLDPASCAVRPAQQARDATLAAVTAAADDSDSPQPSGSDDSDYGGGELPAAAVTAAGVLSVPPSLLPSSFEANERERTAAAAALLETPAFRRMADAALAAAQAAEAEEERDGVNVGSAFGGGDGERYASASASHGSPRRDRGHSTGGAGRDRRSAGGELMEELAAMRADLRAVERSMQGVIAAHSPPPAAAAAAAAAAGGPEPSANGGGRELPEAARASPPRGRRAAVVAAGRGVRPLVLADAVSPHGRRVREAVRDFEHTTLRLSGGGAGGLLAAVAAEEERLLEGESVFVTGFGSFGSPGSDGGSSGGDPAALLREAQAATERAVAASAAIIEPSPLSAAVQAALAARAPPSGPAAAPASHKRR